MMTMILYISSRSKIGFHIAVKLLRANANVIITTRFPKDAYKRFAELPDAGSLLQRIQIYPLDLRVVNEYEEWFYMVLLR